MRVPGAVGGAAARRSSAAAWRARRRAASRPRGTAAAAETTGSHPGSRLQSRRPASRCRRLQVTP